MLFNHLLLTHPVSLSVS